MWTDILELRDFYAGSLGLMARHMIRRRIRETWPNVGGLAVMGVGYATPYLRPFLGEADRVVAFAPDALGAMRWPDRGLQIGLQPGGQPAVLAQGEPVDAPPAHTPCDPGHVVLGNPLTMPFRDRSMDRMILAHCLEYAEHLPALLRECWRVLDESGRLIVIVPNRRGVWARLERTPFATGRPFSEGQMNRLLRDHMFSPMGSCQALYFPPFRSRVMLQAAPAIERMGGRWWSGFGGVVLVEAVKHSYAISGSRSPARASRGLAVPALQPSGARSATANTRSRQPVPASTTGV